MPTTSLDFQEALNLDETAPLNTTLLQIIVCIKLSSRFEVNNSLPGLNSGLFLFDFKLPAQCRVCQF